MSSEGREVAVKLGILADIPGFSLTKLTLRLQEWAAEVRGRYFVACSQCREHHP